MVIIIIALIVIGNMINQTFLQYCATNPVSFGFMLLGYSFISLLMVAIILIAKTIIDDNKEEYKHHIDIRNINSDFKRFYDRLRVENINELEFLRKKVLIKDFGIYLAIYMAISVVFVATVVLKNVTNDVILDFSEFCKYLPFLGTFIAILFATWGEKYSVEYKRIYKENIISNFIKLINPNLTYTYNNPDVKDEKWVKLNRRMNITQEYRCADFDGMYFDYVVEEEWVEGQIDKNHFFTISDIEVKQEYTDSDGDTRTKNIFKGLFYSLEANNNINTCLKININNHNTIHGAQRYKVTMDSPEFEEVFDVYCDDKVLAMRILTTDMMELIMDFYKKYYIQFEICCRYNKIYTRFYVKDMFEPRKIKNSMDIKSLYMYFTIMEFVIEFSKKINKLAEDVEI